MSDSHSPTEATGRLNLGAADFDAYLPEGNGAAQGTARGAIKGRLAAWSKHVASRLESLGIAAEIGDSEADDGGGQRVFFWRDGDARAHLEALLQQGRSLSPISGVPPHRMHAYLTLKIDARAVEVSIEVCPEAWVDFRNIRARLLKPAEALELIAALESLPEQYGLRVTGKESLPFAGIDTNRLRSALDESEVSGQPLWIGWNVPRDVATAHSALLDEQLEDAIVALAPVFRLLAWAPDNDCVELDREWTRARAAKAKAQEEAEREQATWEAKKAADERREAERRAPRRDRASRRTVSAPESLSEPKAEVEAPPVAPPRAALSRVERRLTRGSRVVDVDPNGVVDRGVKVQVLSGAFEGKLGTVQELDGRGGARVLLGLLAVRLDLHELGVVREGRERPTLASSHRRPSTPRQQ